MERIFFNETVLYNRNCHRDLFHLLLHDDFLDLRLGFCGSFQQKNIYPAGEVASLSVLIYAGIFYFGKIGLLNALREEIILNLFESLFTKGLVVRLGSVRGSKGSQGNLCSGFFLYGTDDYVKEFQRLLIDRGAVVGEEDAAEFVRIQFRGAFLKNCPPFLITIVR